MDHVLYILYGHDIDHLSKDELKKVVITQNTKILDDSSDLDKYQAHLENLQAQERDFARIIEQVKADCSKKDAQIKSLHNNIATLGKDVKRHDAVVSKLDEANSEVLRLTEELKDKQDALLKQKNDLTKQIADKVAENVKLNTQFAAIKFNLTQHIQNENINNIKHVTTKKKLEEAKAACEKSIADKLKEIAALKVKEVELMKHHKATEDQSDLISDLKAKLAELTTKKCGNPPVLENGHSSYDGKLVVEGQQLEYKCNSGYIMNKQSTSKLTCKNGNFAPSIAESGMKCSFKHGLKVVAKKLKWEAARQHCVNNFGGHLIQHDPRLYTREDRQEIAQSLNLPIGRSYHTGIRRDGNQIWRRSSDGEEVQLKDWYPSYPASATSAEFLYWGFWNNSDKNTIWNSSDRSYHFICEY